MLNQRVSSGKSMNSIGQDLHDIWHMFIEISKISHPDEVTQERLILLLLYTKALGTLRSGIHGEDVSIITSHGMRVWTDLPSFDLDMLGTWQKSRKFSSAQRLNFAASTGQLIAFDACGIDLSACAVWSLKEALTTHQTSSKIT